MVTIFAHRNGRTEQVDQVDPSWLAADGGVVLWVDMAAPTADESRILSDTFKFHELAVEDSLSQAHHPKIEAYDGYLYLILHGIDFEAAKHGFATHDTDFFLGPNYLVTIHDGKTRSAAKVRDICRRNEQAMAEGPAALLHRIVDAMVDNYLPEVEKLEDKLDDLEKEVFGRPRRSTVKRILELKRDVSSLRRVTLPQRDAVSRLARREFALVPPGVEYRFRDVNDHLVRIADEALIFQDRVTGILEAHLSNVSNRLNEVMKVLTIITTLFMPLTLLTGMYGMNIPLPHLPGGAGLQFWWLLGIMLALSVSMLLLFRRKDWL